MCESASVLRRSLVSIIIIREATMLTVSVAFHKMILSNLASVRRVVEVLIRGERGNGRPSQLAESAADAQKQIILLGKIGGRDFDAATSKARCSNHRDNRGSGEGCMYSLKKASPMSGLG